MLELLGREATSAGRAERVVMRYFRVRIRVRGNADTHLPPPRHLGGTPSRTSFAVFLFLLGPGIVFEYGKGVLSGELPLSRGSREALPISSPKIISGYR